LSPLGIIVAVTAEARSLTKKFVPNGEPIRLPEGAVLSVSGVGPKRATAASRILLKEGVTALLSWGSAGGLSPGLSPGSLILPKTIIASDHSLYSVDTNWHDCLCNRLKGHIDFLTDPLAESTRVMCTPAEKKLLFQQTGAVSVDMESAAVAAVAGEAGIPFIAIRAIADSMDTAIPAGTLKAFDEFGRLRFLGLMLRLPAHFLELPAMIRIARTYRAALRTLAQVARLTEKRLIDFPRAT